MHQSLHMNARGHLERVGYLLLPEMKLRLSGLGKHLYLLIHLIPQPHHLI